MADPTLVQLDFRGLICPLPVLRTAKRLRELPVGTVVEVATTDPAAPQDFRAFCAAAGVTLLAVEEGVGEARVRLVKAP